MNPEARAAEERRTRVQLYAELLVFDNSHEVAVSPFHSCPTREAAATLTLVPSRTGLGPCEPDAGGHSCGVAVQAE